jgi:pimeloyl-ACP methyl ester carboxylesterase
MRSILPSLLLLLLLVMTGCICSQRSDVLSKKIASEPQDEFVDVGHGRLRFRVIRGNSPAIVLESGGAMDSSQWNSLQPEIARLTGLAVVSYDRPGFGESELPSSPYDAAVEMRDLKAALKCLGLPRKVILVGHSYGGMLNQLYAWQNQKDVRGVVLIDPNSVAFMDSIGGAQTLTKETPKELPKPVEANRRVLAGFQNSIETVRPTSFPRDVPMVVITAGKPWWPTEERNKLFRASHEGIVRNNPQRTLVIAEGSGHNVTAERPDVVLSAITNVVARAGVR